MRGRRARRKPEEFLWRTIEVRPVAPSVSLSSESRRVEFPGFSGHSVAVVVRRHLDGTYAIWRGAQRWGRYDATGRPVDAVVPVDRPSSRRPTRHLDRRPTTPAGPQRPQASL